MRAFLIKVGERSIAILAYIFPFIEICYWFGAKVFLSTESVALQMFYLNNIAKLSKFYEANIYLIFIFMVGIFIVCSRGTVPLTKFVRFNVIQAILLNIIVTCLGIVFGYLPVIIRESVLGVMISNAIYLGIVLTMLYSALLIFYGRYPRIPVLSEAAKLQVQRGYLN